MDELTAKTMTPVALFGRHTSTWRTDSTTDTITRQWVVSCLPVLSSQTLPGQLNHSHFPISFPQTVLQSSIQLSAAMCMKDKFSITPSTSWSLYRPYTHMRKCTHTHTHTHTHAVITVHEYKSRASSGCITLSAAMNVAVSLTCQFKLKDSTQYSLTHQGDGFIFVETVQYQYNSNTIIFELNDCSRRAASFGAYG